MRWFPIIRGLVLLIAWASAGVFAILFVLVWIRTWNPFLDDGPFHGTPAVLVRNQPADQTFPIHSGMTLLVFDPASEQSVPIVAMREAEGRVLWAVEANPDSMPGVVVRKIRFSAQRRFPFSRRRVIGVVDWTYGSEATWWFISEQGRLEEFWFSW